ncbi:MAG: type II secretion system F family protein [Candidatus Brennerbacteria bacterium]|nr:type II secretion system F family protein [Candidatus Brennerbacteria bacterium]
MKFKYQARTKTGESQAGTVDAASREAALNILTSHELYILSLENIEKVLWYGKIINFFSRVKAQDLMIFTRQFATLLSAKSPLSGSLKSLYQQSENVFLKEAIFEIISDIDAGLSLSQALDRHRNIFSSFYVNMVRSAEVSGRMEEAMDFMANYLEKEVRVGSRVRNALIYPVFVLGLFVIVGGILIAVVFPEIKPIFEEADVTLPLITRILLSLGDFLVGWWWAIVIFLVLFVVLMIDYFQTDEGRAVFDEMKIRAPILGGFARKLYVARFSQATSVLIRGGIPITQAIEIAGHTVGNVVYQDILREAAEGVRRGELLSQVLSRSAYFPPLVSQMIAIGETTGRLDDLLDKIALFFTQQVDDASANLVELIQPALMSFIGIAVGLLFASILLPIYDLARAF